MTIFNLKSFRSLRSVQTVSIANSSYSEHIRSVHLIITSEHGIREVCDLYDPYGSKNRTHPLLPRNILRPTNEMQSSDRKQLFTDRTRVLQSIRILKWLIRTVSILDNPGFRYTKKHPKNENAKISIRPRNNKACAV